MPQHITMGGACHNVTGHPAATDQSTNVLTRVHSTPDTPTQPRAALYTPFASKDILGGAIGFNVPRLLAGKPLYPLIVRDDQHYCEFEKLRQSLSESLTQSVNTLSRMVKMAKAVLDDDNSSIDTPVQNRANSKFYEQLSSTLKQHELILETLKHFEIRNNQSYEELALLRSGVDKLYLIGHGASGVSKLSADQEGLSVVTAKELADQFAAGGLAPSFDDVRVISCFSADYGTNKEEPFAQSLCNALKMAGFQQPEVSGYQGTRALYSTTHPHHYCRLPDTQEANVRASSVRQRFSATV